MAGAESRRVFILGGGAGLGAHQVGALKYLAEQGLKPDVLICSSIGAINGCVFASGGVEGLEAAWGAFRSLPRLRPSFKNNLLTGNSVFCLETMAAGLEEFMDFPDLLASRLELEIVLLNLSRGHAQMWSNRMCRDWRELRSVARAGYAIPPLFGPVEIRGEHYVDGGLAWNVPLEHAIECRATEVFILAPIASQLPYRSSFKGFADYSARLLDVLWRTIGNTGHLYARIENGLYHGVPVTIIEPGEELSGFSPLGLFHAYPEKSTRMIAAGYRDAKRALERPSARAARSSLRAAS
ncbi:MAG: patatin-like phospholipase family protein [Candidatus Binatia bacterium]